MTDSKLYAIVLEHYKLNQAIIAAGGEFTEEQRKLHVSLKDRMSPWAWYEIENCYKMAKLCNPNHKESNS